MRWINAARIVAGMPNVKAIRFPSSRQKIGEAMRLKLLSAQRKSPVPVFIKIAKPRPTAAYLRAIRLPPKPVACWSFVRVAIYRYGGERGIRTLGSIHGAKCFGTHRVSPCKTRFVLMFVLERVGVLSTLWPRSTEIPNPRSGT